MVERLSAAECHRRAPCLCANGRGVEECSRAIMLNRKGRDTFILGAANVGKSLFVASFLEHALGTSAVDLIFHARNTLSSSASTASKEGRCF